MITIYTTKNRSMNHRSDRVFFENDRHMLLPPIAQFNSCAVCMQNLIRKCRGVGVYHRVDVGFVSESYGCVCVGWVDRARLDSDVGPVVTRPSDDDENDDAEETRAR